MTHTEEEENTLSNPAQLTMISPSHSHPEEEDAINDLNPNPNPNPIQDDEGIHIPQEEGQELDSSPAQTLDHPPQDQKKQDNQDLPAAEEESGMSLLPIKVPDEDAAANVDPPSLTSPTNNPNNNPNRRPNKRKKLNPRKVKIIEKKVHTLVDNLDAFPFKPAKSLDFDRHDAVLKRLGLWDFVHIEFDDRIRVDLIAQLIVNYDPSKRGSYVNDKRIMANRAELSRCFKLPVVKKEKGSNIVEEVDLDSEEYSDDDILFIEDLVSNWMVLHENEAWEMPAEVSNSTRLVKDGHPEKVDWAGLLWQMVEKELVQGERLRNCYYASHLQHLIKSQCEVFFEDESQVEMEVEVKEEEDGGEGNQDLGVEENVLPEEPNIVLTLGQDISDHEEVKDDDMIDVNDADMNNWFSNGKNNMGGHMLQRCDLVESSSDAFEERKQEEVQGGDDEVEEEEVDEVEEEEDGFEMVPNDDSLDREGMTGNFIHGMETTNIRFGLQGQLKDQSSADPFASNSREGTYMMSGQPLYFGHDSGKREMEPEHDMSDYSLNTSNKRMRGDGLWEPKSSDFVMCMDQMQHLLTKAKMIHESKEQAYQESQSCQQHLLDELQQRNDLIEHLRRSKGIEIAKKDDEIVRLENELYLMANLLEGYKKALKDTQKAFSEYRHRYQLPEESIYRDAGRGLVLSTTELERRRQKQEEEDRSERIFLQQRMDEYLVECMHGFKVHYDTLITLDNRLVEFENTVKLLKESSVLQRTQKCQDVPMVNDVSLQNPSDATDMPFIDASSEKLSDATEVQVNDAITQRPSDSIESQVNDTNLQNPSDAMELQINDSSLQNPSDASELQVNETSLPNPYDATGLQVSDTSLQKPSGDTELQANDTSLENPSDATELQVIDTSLENPSDATQLAEVVCDLEPEAQ